MYARVIVVSGGMSIGVRHGGLMVVVGVAILMLLLLVWQQLGIRERRRRFANRRLLDEDFCFRVLKKADAAQRGLVRELLQSLASEIGVSWNQLRSEDTFEDHLRISRRFAPWNDLDELEETLVSWARNRGISYGDLPPFRGTLNEFVYRVVELDTSHRVR